MSWTRDRTVLSALLVLALGAYLTGGALAQEPYDAEDCEPTGDWRIALDCLSSGKKSRFFRSFTIAISGIDQPNFIFVPGTGGFNLEETFRNPDDELYKLDLTFAPERWFKTPGEFGSVLKTGLALQKAEILLGRDPYREVAGLDYFARTRPGDGCDLTPGSAQ